VQINKRSFIALGIAGIAIGSAITFVSIKILTPSVATKNLSAIPMSYQGNIIKATQENTDFRRVLFTGLNSQLVVMSIPPGGEVGAETHKYTEQTLFFLSGTGEGELNSKKFPIGPGSVVFVVPGTEHNFLNTGTEPLKIDTVYAPPNHLDGLVEATKADADANTADEAIGETPPVK
jgi:mannose-6-phosphate isomerase-like protein (cupin superfamily)